jgi:hypothetical protein
MVGVGGRGGRRRELLKLPGSGADMRERGVSRVGCTEYTKNGNRHFLAYISIMM